MLGKVGRDCRSRAAIWESACKQTHARPRVHKNACACVPLCLSGQASEQVRADRRPAWCPLGMPSVSQESGLLGQRVKGYPAPPPWFLIKHLTAMPNNSFCCVFFLMSLCEYEAGMKGFGGPPRERKSRNRGEERVCRGLPAESRHPLWRSATWLQRPFARGNGSSSLGHDNRCFVRGGRGGGSAAARG